MQPQSKFDSGSDTDGTGIITPASTGWDEYSDAGSTDTIINTPATTTVNAGMSRVASHPNNRDRTAAWMQTVSAARPQSSPRSGDSASASRTSASLRCANVSGSNETALTYLDHMSKMPKKSWIEFLRNDTTGNFDEAIGQPYIKAWNTAVEADVGEQVGRTVSEADKLAARQFLKEEEAYETNLKELIYADSFHSLTLPADEGRLDEQYLGVRNLYNRPVFSVLRYEAKGAGGW